MNALAQRILGIITEATAQSGYIATWGIAEKLGVRASEFRTMIPRTEYDKALDTLIEQGFIEEIPDLALRFRLASQGLRYEAYSRPSVEEVQWLLAQEFAELPVQRGAWV